MGLSTTGRAGSVCPSEAGDGRGAVDQMSRLRASHAQELRFVIVGVWNTLFAYAVWASLQFALGSRINYLFILILAWPIAVANAYVCQRRFVFRSSEPIRSELPKFSMVYIFSLVATLVGLPILLAVLPLNIYVAQAVFTVGIVAATYVLHRRYSFGGATRRSVRPDPGRNDG